MRKNEQGGDENEVVTADELHEYSWQEYAGTLKQTTNLSKRKTIMNFIQAIINFFLSLFGGKKSTASASESASASAGATVQTVEPQTFSMKTDKQMFYNYIVIGEDYNTKDALWNEAMKNEQNGIYDYKLTGKLAWYRIRDGQLVGNGTVAKPAVKNSNNAEGTNMRQAVFNVMVAGEKNSSVVESVRKQMAEKDALSVYPYTISTDSWIYTITKPDEPYFSQYGTQFSAVPKHK